MVNKDGSGEPAGQTGAGNDPAKKDDIYEDRGPKKIIRLLTVLAYMFSVSFVGIVLSAYYLFLWEPPNPKLIQRTYHLSAEPQADRLIGDPAPGVNVEHSDHVPAPGNSLLELSSEPEDTHQNTDRAIFNNSLLLFKKTLIETLRTDGAQDFTKTSHENRTNSSTSVNRGGVNEQPVVVQLRTAGSFPKTISTGEADETRSENDAFGVARQTFQNSSRSGARSYRKRRDKANIKTQSKLDGRWTASTVNLTNAVENFTDTQLEKIISPARNDTVWETNVSTPLTESVAINSSFSPNTTIPVRSDTPQNSSQTDSTSPATDLMNETTSNVTDKIHTASPD